VSLVRRRPDARPTNLAGSQAGTTYGPKTPTEPIPDNFAGYVSSCFRGNGIVAAVEAVRLNVFAEARFQWQALNSGTPGKLFGTPELAILEQPWVGGTTGDLLTRMILDADFAGNAYVARIGNELVRLRPDWVDIVLAPRMAPYGPGKSDAQVGFTKVGYVYWEGGKRRQDVPAATFLPNEVAHFAPTPDPVASYRGMSWLTPVIREIQADQHTVTHKLKFFENNASVNLAVVAKENLSPEQFNEWVDSMDRAHMGVRNAYKTLYLSAGADVTPVGSTMQQMDFANTQGAGEVRIANAAGIHPVVIGLVTSLGGSSLNAGNYGAAKRSTVDRTFRPLWRNVAGSLQSILKPPAGGQSRLWFDTADIAFLRDDEKDLAEIHAKEAQTVRTLLDAGFEADSVKAAVIAGDWSLLTHSGLFSVQLQAPMDHASHADAQAASDAQAAADAEHARKLSIAESVQKVYLGVGSLITSDEAREIVNEAGADLPVPGPDFKHHAAPPPGVPTARLNGHSLTHALEGL
jgi:phage portal protein BeeE